MAMDPASAFLRGFATVDQLETNRQQRAFREEEMSRTRKMWEREDDEYERFKLERYRNEKLAQFQGVMDDVMRSNPDMHDLWEQKPELAWQEGMKRMIAQDPEFGEHVALAMGLDPAAGEFIRNKKAPVSGAVIRPTPVGVELGFELDTINGKQPYTEGRSSRPNDPVAFRRAGMNELVKVFGQGVMADDLRIATMMRELAGVERPGPTSATSVAPEGKPQQQSTQQQAPQSDAATVADAAPTFTKEETDTQGLSDAEEALARTNSTNPDDVQFSAGGEQVTGRIPAPGETVEAEYVEPESTSQWAKSVVEAADSDTVDVKDAGLGATLWSQRDVAWENIKESGAKVAAFVRGFQLVQGSEAAPVQENDLVEEPATKPSDVPDKSTYAPGNAANDPDKAINNAGVTGTAAATSAAANDVLRTGRPTLMQVYNAAGLARMGAITKDQFAQYARTGTFEEPAAMQLRAIGNGQYAVFNPNTGEIRVGGAGGGAGTGMASIKTWQAYTNLMQDRTNGIFEENKGAQDAFLSNMDEVYRIFGNPMQTEAQLTAASQSNLTRYVQQGAQYIMRYDPDTAQNLFQGTGDLNPLSDPELRMTPAAIAVGTRAGFDGISNQYDANEYLTQYAWKLGNAMQGVAPGALVANVANLEATVKARLKANPDLDRNAVRREVVEEFIEKIGG